MTETAVRALIDDGHAKAPDSKNGWILPDARDFWISSRLIRIELACVRKKDGLGKPRENR